MSFSAQTCLTYTGTTTLGGTFNVYTNNDYVTPLSSVTLTQITTNCPFVFIVPDGTTSIRLLDILTSCYVDIPVNSNNTCSFCDLNLKGLSNNQIGTISSDILTGSCQSNISQYLINWYGPDSTTTLAFTSGSGTTFPHQYNHPFQGTSSIPVQQGTYYPVIENVILSGISFSNTGGTGNVLANLNCIDPIYVDCYRCNNTTNSNGNYPYSAYNHHIQFSVTSQLSAQPVSTTFKISATTNFIAWAFKGENAPDKVKLTLSGQNYSQLIGLEDIWVGLQTSSNNFAPSTLPKSAITEYFYNKITTLTGLTISDGDIILIEITPSTVNTNWDFYFTCLESYDCVDCVTNDSIYKIVGSTISGTTGTCDTNVINFYLSGCSNQDFMDSDYIKYYVNTWGNSPYLYNYGYPNTVSNTSSYHNQITPGINGLIQSPYFGYSQFFTQNSCNVYTRATTNSLCSTSTSPTVFEKSFSLGGNLILSITGDSTVISTMYNQWNYYKTGTFIGYTFDSNSANTGYYGYFLINFPNLSTPNYCADPTPTDLIVIHPSSNMVTGTTGSDYFISITSTTIGNGTSFTTCDLNCNTNVSNVIYAVNNYSTGGTSQLLTFSSGFYYQNLIRNLIGLTSGLTNAQSTFRTGGYTVPLFETNTYPFSGSPATLIPSLSGSCCYEYTIGGNISNYYGGQIISKYKYYYVVTLTNPSDVRDFDISANTISNGVVVGPYVLAYRYSGGSVTYSNPTYII